MGVLVPSAEEFVDEVISSLSEVMQVSTDALVLKAISNRSPPTCVQNKTVQAQCVYLRGFFRVCQKKLVDGFDDLYDRLQRMEVQLVPDTK